MTSYGRNIKIAVFGGSHDPEIGVTVENLPAGIRLDREYIAKMMARRAPGQNQLSTARVEADAPVILSGIDKNDCTDGGVFRAVIRSLSQRSGDYDSLRNTPRPSHADYPATVKSGGSVDLRGGGHFSGRLTAPLCLIGAILKRELERQDIFVGAHIESVGNEYESRFDPVSVSRADFESILSHDLPTIEPTFGERITKEILAAKKDGDSVGGIIECAVVGLPVGVGEHIFDGMESRIASLSLSVPAVKGIEFGLGFASTDLYGSENNDPWCIENGSVRTKTNNSGGILGGMTTGMPLIFRVAVKPTPSIAREQDTVDLSTMTETKITVGGRHDPCIVPRAVPVMEAVAAIAIFDALLDEGEMEK